MEYLTGKVEGIDDLPEQLLAEGKPAYIVEEVCMHELTQEFRPSRYNYLISVVEEDFQSEYLQLLKTGVLTYEVINLLKDCDPIFDYLKFSEENEDDRKIRYAIIRAIQLHLVGSTIDRDYLSKIDFTTLA